jgi:hypothetical protein
MLTQELVKDLFDYDPDTGVLTWKIKPSKKVQIGDIAGCINAQGYLVTKINYKLHYNHRIAYLHHHGHLPEFIDHIKGRSNKINNLRECTLSQNSQNAKLSSRNTSGIKGVSWFKPLKKWRARLSINRKQQPLGYFTEISDAESAVKSARKKHHGEFACHN